MYTIITNEPAKTIIKQIRSKLNEHQNSDMDMEMETEMEMDTGGG